jgi:hypothetical protein
MAGEAHFDLVAAHKHFSAWCFNCAWELIEKPIAPRQRFD